jgi:hypothetical protein
MMAEVIQAPVQQTEVQPTASQQFDIALETGDPKQMISVAQQNPNTPVAVAAVKVADLFHTGNQTVSAMMQPINDVGGIGTPKGNIVAANEAKKYFSQEKPQIWNAFIYALTGNDKMAQAAITGGDVVYKTVPDKSGKLVQVGINQLGRIIDAEDVDTGRKISRQDYEARSIGRQTYENTLDYLTQKEQAVDNTQAWQAKIKRDSIAEQTYRGVIAPLAKRTFDDLEFVKNLDISPEEKSKVFKFVNNSYSAASRSGEEQSFLNQKQANAEANAGKDLSDAERIKAGLPAGLYQWSKDGVVNKNSKESFSYGRLLQGTNSNSKSNEIENSHTQDRASLDKYLRTANLSKEQQDRILRIFDAGKEIGQSILKLQADGNMPKFLYTPNTSDAEDPFAIIQGKTVQLLTNAQLLRLNAEYSNSARDAAAQKGGVPPNPFDIEAGFSRSKDFRNVINEGMAMTNDIISRDVQTRNAKQLGPAKTFGPAVPPQTKTPVNAGAGVAPAENIANEVVAEAAKVRNDQGNRGAPVLDEVPGYAYSGKRNAAGQKLFTKNGDKSGKLYAVGE